MQQSVVPRLAQGARLDRLTLRHKMSAETVEAQSVGFYKGLPVARGLRLEL